MIGIAEHRDGSNVLNETPKLLDVIKQLHHHMNDWVQKSGHTLSPEATRETKSSFKEDMAEVGEFLLGGGASFSSEPIRMNPQLPDTHSGFPVYSPTPLADIPYNPEAEDRYQPVKPGPGISQQAARVPKTSAIPKQHNDPRPGAQGKPPSSPRPGASNDPPVR